jgi:hypothetical protein
MVMRQVGGEAGSNLRTAVRRPCGAVLVRWISSRRRRVDDLFIDPLAAQALHEPLKPGIPVEPFEVLPQALTDVGAGYSR